MILEQIGPAACRSYIVGCEQARRVAVVDPLEEDVDRVVERLERDGLALQLIVDTHTHADHHSGGRALAECSGAPYGLHEATECAGVDERLRDGSEIAVGRIVIEVLHTPGHTPDSLTLRAGPNLFTGDFLFLAQDGAGRLDLPGGDAGAHWDSLQRLAAFDDPHRVLPGHDYQNNADATLGTERRRNPRFQNVTRDEYVAWQRAVASATPQWMLDVIAANLGHGAAHAAHHDASHTAAPAALTDASTAATPAAGAACDDASGAAGACAAGPLECVPLVLADEAHRRREQPETVRPFLLDVREPWEYAAPYGCHAPGAHLIPLGQLPARLGELPDDRERELLVICKSGGRSAHAVAFLIQQGWRRVFNVARGTDGWVQSGLPVES